MIDRISHDHKNHKLFKEEEQEVIILKNGKNGVDY